jgi:hypothetical protein
MSGMMGMAVRYFSLAEEQWLDRWMLRAALLLLTTLLAVLLTRARSSAANNRTHPSFSTVANGIQSPSDVSANDSDDESDEEEEEDYAKRYKMVLVIRMDLKMSSGKIAAQVCSA